MRVLLLGPPGAGKGTLGQKLSAHYGVPHIAAGELIRDHIAQNTEFGRRVERQIAAGNFAADADIIPCVCARLAQPDAARGCVLDGFPRNVAQAIVFAEQCGTLDAVLELTASADALHKRLTNRRVCEQCGRTYSTDGFCDTDGARLVRRPDDAAYAVARRMEVYEQVTAPLRGFYAAEGLLHAINASVDADAVFRAAIRIVRTLTLGPKNVRAGV